jgi:HAD superfamily hydrolase (TIGR01490 family)
MTLAIFDLDFTLLEGDSEWLWSKFLMTQGIVGEEFIAQIESYYRDYEAGRLDFDAYERFLLTPQTQLSPQQLKELRKIYLFEIIRPRLSLRMLERVAWHRTQGHTLLLITASNAFLAKPIAQLLQFSNLICTQIDNGKPIGTPAFRVGKVTLLQAWLVKHEKNLAGSWGYSDSQNDLPLLQQVSHPVAVRPDAVLRSHAVQAGWEIL